MLPFVRPTRSRAEEERLHRPRKTNAHKQISREFRNAPSDWEYIKKYRPGQFLQCHILKAEPGGYSVITSVSALPGYLASNRKHQTGEIVLVSFVCVNSHGLLLSELFTARGSRSVKGNEPGCEFQLDSVESEQPDDNLDESASRADAEKDDD